MAHIAGMPSRLASALHAESRESKRLVGQIGLGDKEEIAAMHAAIAGSRASHVYPFSAASCLKVSIVPASAYAGSETCLMRISSAGQSTVDATAPATTEASR